MRFIRVHKVATYLMVFTSTLALTASGELHPPLGVIVLAGVALSWFWEPPRIERRVHIALWNVLTLIMFGKVVLDLLAAGSLLETGVHFLLFLVLNKLFNRRTSRDYQQLFVLSFLELVAATVLNADLTFGLLFAAYIVFATWALILSHLKREMEGNYLLKYGDSLTGRPVQVQRVLNSRKLIGGRFLAATSLVSVVIFAGACVVFFAFPRIGLGVFFKKRRPGITMTGFSDRIELGNFGLIKDDPTVVMRVEFGDPQVRRAMELHWRGISFDHYDGRTWTKSRARRRKVQLVPRRGLYPLVRRYEARATHIEQEIYLEPMDTPMVFGLPRVEAVRLHADEVPTRLRLPHTRLMRDLEGDVHYSQMDQLAFRYWAYSQPERIPAEVRDMPLAEYRRRLGQFPRAASYYLQLPPRQDPRVSALAAEIIGDSATIGEAVYRMERHLRREYAYTLDLRGRGGDTPLEDFLFDNKRGHCEFFSTAMVILLRTQGIGARNVNGFYGGTWNEYGQYLAISQGDAHSWVEVWLPGGAGSPWPLWLTADPTPSGPGRALAGGVWDRLAQYADALRLRWYKYVIEYDLRKQIGALQQLRDLWARAAGHLGGLLGSEGGRGRAVGSWLLGAVLALVIAAALTTARGRAPATATRTGAGPPPSPQAGQAAELYEAMTGAYARLGFARTASTTARELVTLLERRGAPEPALARRVVAVYESIRFGGREVDPAEVGGLRREIRGLGRRR